MMVAGTLALVGVLLAFGCDTMREVRSYATAAALGLLAIVTLAMCAFVAVGAISAVQP